LRWSCDPHDTGPVAQLDELILVFARSAAPSAGSAEVLFADDLLDWQTRSEIEHRAGDLLAKLRARVADTELLEASEYQLRVEWVNLLLAHAVGAALRDAGPFTELTPSSMTPAAIVAGVASALGITAPSTATGPARASGRKAAIRSQIARLVVTARAATTSTRKVRVLAFPGLKLGEALGELSGAQLAGAGVGVAAVAELGYGEAAKLVLRHALPAVALPRGSGGERSAAGVPLSDLTGSPALDVALAHVARAALDSGAQIASEISAVLPRLERLPALRAIVVPTAALGATRALGSWAGRHGIRVASFQHGIYGMIEGDGGDRRADVLFGWGPAVAGQVAMWTQPRPRLEVVGVPGLARAARRAAESSLRRVLVATTNAPTGNALAPWSIREDYLDALADGLARLRRAGVEIELRLHPVESAAEYATMAARAGRDPLRLAPPGPFAQVAERADLLIAPFSSVAYEAAALAIPVAIWIPRVPAAVRAAHFVPPLAGELPGTFADAAGFDELIAHALDDPANGLEAARSLTRSLEAYVAPLDTSRFASALARLGA